MSNTLLCRVDPAARLWVTGPDAATYLQGQFTNDLRREDKRPATYGLWLNQKGRVLADSFVLQHAADRFEVISLTSPAEVIRERLEAYIIADEVSVEDATAGTAGWIVAGEGAAGWLEARGGEVPAVGGFSVLGERRVVRARAAGGPNWMVFGPPGLDTGGTQAVAEDELAFSRLEAGVPEIPTELGPDDLPNEGGLEHEAISFTKGCYLGQEVMARLHNLGQVRRRLFIVRSAGDAGPAPAPRAELLLGAKRVGEIRRFIVLGARNVGLAMLHTSFVQPGDRLALAPAGPATLVVERLAEGRAP